MDSRHFDALTRVLSIPDSRRRLLALLATWPLLGGLLGILDPGDAAAKERRRRRKQRHKRRKTPGTRKKGCRPKSRATACAGRCGPVKSRQTCGKTIDCGSCACNPPCPVCFTCQDQGPNAPGGCVVDATQVGASCGGNGKVCQPDGACACIPRTECPVDKVCGTIPDGCGGSLDCGTCANPTPVCDADNACVACESSDECASGEICDGGSCQPCDVICAGNAATCGAALQDAITAATGGATLYVCPGRYAGGFSIATALTLIGAGQGDDPDTATILDGTDTERVLHIPGGTGAVVLAGLRLTGGRDSDFGAGLYHEGESLEARDCTIAGNQGVTVWGAGIANLGQVMTLRRCTIRDNHAINDGLAQGDGGGVYSYTGILTLEDCLVTDNQADNVGGGLRILGASAAVVLTGTTEVRQNTAFRGGGLYVTSSNPVEIAASCRVTKNEAEDGEGGGIYVEFGTVTLLGDDDPSPIVVNNCHENCVGDVPKCAATPVSCPP